MTRKRRTPRIDTPAKRRDCLSILCGLHISTKRKRELIRCGFALDVGVNPLLVSALGWMLRDMQKDFQKHRVCFGYYPTGWRHDPRGGALPTARGAA